jgi:ATP-dependent helicase/nuclease subunit B
MLSDFGLPEPERRIGQAAHDFTQAFSAPSVVLTRSAKSGGTPTVPSRWLLRLDNMGGASAPERDTRWLHWQGLLDQPKAVRAAPPPAPRPPVEARPRRLSVTQVETWMRDPYGIYARHILKLRALHPIDADPGAADYGTLIHQALDDFLGALEGPLPDDALDLLIDSGRKTFGRLLDRPGVWAFWWPRFERIAEWIIPIERRRRDTLRASANEASGSLTLDGPAGPFKLTARADRLDMLNDGTVTVIDYKTGAPPSSAEVAAGFAPQLPLEAAIVEAGGFEGVPAAAVSALEYWRLRGGNVGGEIKSAGADVPALIAQSVEGLGRLIAAFDSEDTPYEARPRPDQAPRFSDYEHLARVREWSVAGGDEG